MNQQRSGGTSRCSQKISILKAELYEDMNAFYKLKSHNYSNYNMVYTHLEFSENYLLTSCNYELYKSASLSSVLFCLNSKCALSGMSRPCRHRIKLGDKENYYYISPSSRARITAVCNFFTYIRYIQQGLVRQDVQQMFWELMRLRGEMSVAKLGYFLTEEN